jgi:predicted HTH domain antitoxin
MYEITLTLPEETANALNTSLEAMADEVKMAAAVKLFEVGRLSSGAAAELAGLPRTVFLTRLADYGVNTFALTETELAEDLANA